MTCCLVALDKRPGLRPVVIGETLRRSLAKLVMKAAGDQTKTVCGDLQLCAGLDDGIEVSTHAVGQQRLERVRARWSEEEAGSSGEEEETDTVVVGLNNLTI